MRSDKAAREYSRTYGLKP